MNIKIGEQIVKFRKAREMSQEKLALLLGVTNQSVSKWEMGKCYPDLELIPEIAKIFGCTVDVLLGGEEINNLLPLVDDGVVRGVVAIGNRIVEAIEPINGEFTFKYVGEAKSVSSQCNLIIEGRVQGDCASNNNIQVNGSVGGDCNAGNDFGVSGSVEGNANAGNNLSVAGDVGGTATGGNNVTVAGCVDGCANVGNDLSVGEEINGIVRAGGNVEAKVINGNVSCETCKCGEINDK